MAASAQPTASDTKSFRGLAASYLKPRPLGAFLLGISSGFPLTLLIWTMSYWLSKVGVDKKTIGFAFALGTPYTLKFLWAPLIDGISIPVLTRFLGQRRAWLWTVQVLLVVAVDRARRQRSGPSHRALRALGRDHRLPLGDAGHRHRRLPHRDLAGR